MATRTITRARIPLRPSSSSSSSSSTLVCFVRLLLLLLLLSLTWTTTVVVVDASTLDSRPEDLPLACPICRRTDRPLLTPDHQFTMVNGITWTCKYLQETVQDVDEYGWESERIMCRSAQLQAEQHGCRCGGDALAPLQSQYVDLNPACNMCARVATIQDSKQNVQLSPIPFENKEKLVHTGIIGTHNCQGLFEALADGILSSTLCPQIQTVAGPVCCVSTTEDNDTTTMKNNVIGTASNTAAQQNSDYSIRFNTGPTTAGTTETTTITTTKAAAPTRKKIYSGRDRTRLSSYVRGHRGIGTPGTR